MSSLDLSPFAEAKSDQLNADDLIGGPRTIRITRVVGDEDSKRVSIYFEGDGGKPFRPCKTVVRVLMALWGKYASEYTGRSITIFRDPDVEFGGLATGGIRVSHASHIDKETKVVVLKTRGKKAAITVKPLKAEVVSIDQDQTDAFGLAPVDQGPATPSKADQWTEEYLASVKACDTIEALMELQAKSSNALAKLSRERPDLAELTTNAGSKRAGELQEAFAG